MSITTLNLTLTAFICLTFDNKNFWISILRIVNLTYALHCSLFTGEARSWKENRKDTVIPSKPIRSMFKDTNPRHFTS